MEKAPELVQDGNIIKENVADMVQESLIVPGGAPELIQESTIIMEKGPQMVQETVTDRSSSSESEKDIEAGPTPEQASKPPGALVLPKWRLVVLTTSLCCGLFLSLLDTTIVATALHSIGDEFDTLENTTWVALAYTLAYLGCCVIFSSLGDVVGRRNAYISAFVIFFAFSMGCGFAQSLNQLIAFRALQGVAGAGLYSLTFVIFPEISPPAMQQFIGSLAGMTVALSGMSGPLLGGVLTRYASWRWCFWINPPFGIIPLIGFIVAWPRADQMAHAQRRSFRELDFVGCVLLIAASVLTVFAFQEGGLGNGNWSTAIFITPLVIGVICWASLVGWQVLVSRLWEQSVAAIFPLRLLRRRVYMAAMLSTLLTGFPYYVVIFSLPLRLQVVNEKSPLAGGIGLLPMLGAGAIGSIVGGIANGKKNLSFYTSMAGCCTMLVGTGLMSTLGPSLEVEAKMYGFQIFVGLGFGLIVSTASLLAVLECQIRDAAVATGIIAQMRVLGGSIGIAASTAILGATQRRELAGVVSSAQLASLQQVARTLTRAQMEAIRLAYSDSFREEMVVSTIVAGICVLLTLGTWQSRPLPPLERRKQQIAEEVERQTRIAKAKAIAQSQAQAQTQAEGQAVKA